MLFRSFAADGVTWSCLRIDGGMAMNGFLAQDLADILGIAVDRPANVESSALGAAMLGAVGAGLHANLNSAGLAMRRSGTRFAPALTESARADRLAAWDRSVATITGGSS